MRDKAGFAGRVEMVLDNGKQVREALGISDSLSALRQILRWAHPLSFPLCRWPRVVRMEREREIPLLVVGGTLMAHRACGDQGSQDQGSKDN